MSLFIASPEIEGRNAVEAENWVRHKKTFYSELYILFYLLSTLIKKLMFLIEISRTTAVTWEFFFEDLPTKKCNLLKKSVFMSKH
jgi:hypothetical protein